jgi:hypothetical protein
VDFIVTGHTPHPGVIKCYGGRIFDIDVGMTPACGENTPQALVVSDSGILAFSANDATGSDDQTKRLASF